MIVVSDTSPLNYLVLIGADQLLPSLFRRVLTPPEVLAEMQHAKAPPQVSAWAQNPPAWLEVSSPQETPEFPRIRAGRIGCHRAGATRACRRPSDR
jgi:predicted nucleic acid-binding protein